MEHSYIEFGQVCRDNICPDLPPQDLVSSSTFEMSTHRPRPIAFVESTIDHFCGECEAPERSEQRLSWLEHPRRRDSSVDAVEKLRYVQLSEGDIVVVLGWLEGTGRREAESDSFGLAHLAYIYLISWHHPGLARGAHSSIFEQS